MSERERESERGAGPPVQERTVFGRHRHTRVAYTREPRQEIPRYGTTSSRGGRPYHYYYHHHHDSCCHHYSWLASWSSSGGGLPLCSLYLSPAGELQGSHTVIFFLPAHLNVNYLYQFWAKLVTWSKNMTWHTSSLSHTLALKTHCNLHWLQWSLSSNLPCSPSLSNLLIGNVLFILFLFF